MNTIRHLAVAALGMSVLALAGCPDATVDPEPSITFAGIADYAVITEGGTSTIYWQTRLADDVEVLVDGVAIDNLADVCIPNIASGGPLEDMALLGTEPCANDPEEQCVRPDDDPESCIDSGALQVSPEGLTSYTIRALRDGGDCSRRDGIGDLVNPTQCDEWLISPIEVEVLPAAAAEFEGGAETLSVTAGTEATVNFTAMNAAELTVGILDASGEEPTIAPCDLEEDATAESVCTYTFNVDTGEGAVTITVDQDTTLGLQVLNGADDTLGNVEDTIDLVVGGV